MFDAGIRITVSRNRRLIAYAADGSALGSQCRSERRVCVLRSRLADLSIPAVRPVKVANHSLRVTGLQTDQQTVAGSGMRLQCCSISVRGRRGC